MHTRTHAHKRYDHTADWERVSVVVCPEEHLAGSAASVKPGKVVAAVLSQVRGLQTPIALS